MFGGVPVLPEAVGWLVIVAFGFIFSGFTTFLVWLDYNYGDTKKTSEQFNTAGRFVKTGLTGAVIVSFIRLRYTLVIRLRHDDHLESRSCPNGVADADFCCPAHAPTWRFCNVFLFLSLCLARCHELRSRP